MQTDHFRDYFLKAVDAFKRKFFIITSNFEILAVNAGDFDMPVQNLIGKKCHQEFSGRISPCDNCPALEALYTQSSAIWESRANSLKEDHGSCLYAYPLLSGNETEAVAVMDFDLPILTGLEEKLKRSNAFLRNLMLSSVDGVIAADLNGKLLIFNDAASEISGYEVEEALSKLDIRDIYPGQGAKEVMKKLRSDDYGGKGKLKSYQVDFLRKTGEIIPISLNAAIVYEGEKEAATIGFFHDLREQIEMKNELEKTQVQLLQAEKMASLGKLAAGVAHQLNNPLGGITLFTKLVMEEYDHEEAVIADLKRILKDAERCRDTVKELLEFARQTRQETRLHDINQAISRTLFLLENQALFQNIEIEKKLSDDLPPVPGDIQQLNHLFMNIILNAAQAMEGSGKLTIETKRAEQKDSVCISISDTGPGIPDDVMPHIFDPFFTTKEAGKGTGLGLSMAYGIVQNHGGVIYAKNFPGRGTTFTVELSLKKQEKLND
ncbi:MAG: ATP-binding protein [Desulfobacterales bacterium]